MKVFCTVTANSGARVPLVLEGDHPVLTPGQLRERVSEATGIPLPDLRLIFRGRMIKDEGGIGDVVAEFKLEEDSVLHCMGKPVPAGGAAVSASASASASSGAAAASESPRVHARSAVPPLSTATAASVATAAAAAGGSPPSGGASDPLGLALERLRSGNPPSVYATAVGTLGKVLGNIVSHPMEEKYRRVKKQNPAFRKRLGGLAGGHDCMLACGFRVEVDEGENAEVYKLHATADSWNALVEAKTRVEEAVAKAAAGDRQQPVQAPGPAGLLPGGGFPPPGGLPNDPALRDSVSRMMSDPRALQAALQNPMLQQMIRSDPSVSPMLRQHLEQLSNNPAMLQQMARQMRDPATMAMFQRAMGEGGPPGPAAPPGGPAPQPPRNDSGQTEEEMIAEAIRRSLEDN
ncbi:unnamed protein product [Pseudo-nitzschia multistriata]|uniref:Ubiquitin-like domain-containing protein n=1 Tax=Pseudo-nitzschia multistriata TaxID=183589 RepID=A0A448ZQX1_9STRA|nr:unnamed protein product [Pseudo-nitzschia multistriata]